MANKLQRGYQSFADMFGVSKLQVKRVVDRSKDKGLIKTEFRTITTKNIVANNVLSIEPDPELVFKLTYPQDAESTERVTPPYFKIRTNTKTTKRLLIRIQILLKKKGHLSPLPHKNCLTVD
jgi:hypothetical protein